MITALPLVVEPQKSKKMDDLDEIREIEDTLVKVWGSQDQAYAELDSQVSDFNRTLFDGKLPPLNIAIVTRWMLAGPLGTSENAAATYNPSSLHLSATVYLGRAAIVSKDRASIILTHEMIHHWEATVAKETEETNYPAEINKIINQIYGNTIDGRRWRAAHSNRFLAKANAVSIAKGWDIAQLLTGQKDYDWLEA